jgi:hypothetical protein
VTFLRLAIRNIMRNARRSAITVAAIAVGMAALLFLWSFIDGVNEQMIDNSTRLLSGHLQVHRSGYHDEQTLDLLLPDPGPAADARSPGGQHPAGGRRAGKRRREVACRARDRCRSESGTRSDHAGGNRGAG